jgi:hypothetical protein
MYELLQIYQTVISFIIILKEKINITHLKYLFIKATNGSLLAELQIEYLMLASKTYRQLLLNW